MSPKSNADLFESIRTQAMLRVKLGFPVCVLMLLCIWYWGPPMPAIGPSPVIPVFALHILYNLAILHIAHPASRINPNHIAVFTALMDPLLLSAGLALMGQAGQLFVCL